MFDISQGLSLAKSALPMLTCCQCLDDGRMCVNVPVKEKRPLIYFGGMIVFFA
jgi:hypothetical protein